MVAFGSLPMDGTMSFYECRFTGGGIQTLPAVMKFV